MRLNQIRIDNVRNINNAIVDPGPNLNIMLGSNGSGKSSFLESIYLLGRAGSFRTNHASEIINREARRLLVCGNIQGQSDIVHRIGVCFENKKKTIRIDGRDVYSRVDLLECFPLQFISPHSYLLVEGPPNTRRQFLDWGVFHWEVHYPEEWKRFKRCLIQRNTALKAKSSRIDRIWDVEFVKYGTIVADRRKEYLEELRPFIREIGETILPSRRIEVDYFAGWDLCQDLDQALAEDYKRDSKFGFTHRGPHKGDLLFKIDGQVCKSYLSRGQTKLFVLVLKLAQIRLQIQKRNRFGSLLIDDFCAELDRENAQKLKQFLSDLDLQCFITAMDRESVGPLYGLQSTLFHVEQGQITAI
jgi:DNA replication and repair protein RecF